MALEKAIIKSRVAEQTTFEYKPKELSKEVSEVARNFVDVDAFRSTDFKLSELIAEQSGISALKDSAQQDKINSQVLERLKSVQEDAYKQGYDLGLIEGTEKAFQENKAELEKRLHAVDKILKKMEELRSQLLLNYEAELVTLVFQVAQRLALKDLEEHREAVVEIITGVVGDLQSDEKILIHLSPEDALFIETLNERAEEKVAWMERTKLIHDDKIKPGGCMIETSYGTVDATVEERVSRAWQTLQSRIPVQPPPQDNE